MDETMAADRPGSDPPDAAVKRRRGISIVWADPARGRPDRRLPGLPGLHREGPDDHAQLRDGRGPRGGQDQGALPRRRGRHGGRRCAIAPDLKHIVVTAGMVPGAEPTCASGPPSGSSSRASASAACPGSAPCCPAPTSAWPPARASRPRLHGPGAAAADRRQRGRPALHADRREPGLGQPRRPDLLPRPRHRPGPGPPARPRRAGPADRDLRPGAPTTTWCGPPAASGTRAASASPDDLGHRRPGRLAAVAHRRRDRVRQPWH